MEGNLGSSTLTTKPGVEKKPLFMKLNDFAKSFTRSISDLKNDFSKPPGSYPDNYYAGIDSLKREIKGLKKAEEYTRIKMDKILQFGYFVQSTKELLMEQEKDVAAMETYLAQFGYEIPKISIEKQESLLKPEEITDKSTVLAVTKDSLAFVSPDLSEVGKVVLGGNPKPAEVPKCSYIPKTQITKVCNVKPIYPTTPLQKRPLAWYATPTPNFSAQKKIERWLEGVESRAVIEITPTVCNQTKFLRFRPLMQEKSVSSTTPEEPELSCHGTMKKPHRHTPEEPQLSSFGRGLIENGKSAKETITPEDPILSRHLQRERLENDGMSSDSSVPNSTMPSFTDIPTSPLLSDITQKVLNVRCFQFSNLKQEDTPTSVDHLENRATTPSKCEENGGITVPKEKFQSVSEHAGSVAVPSQKCCFKTPERTCFDFDPSTPDVSEFTKSVMCFRN